MHYLDMDFIEELITAKIKGRVIRKNMFLRLLSNRNFDYQTKIRYFIWANMELWEAI